MKTIYQDPDSNECGVACVAMLAGIDFEIAKSWVYEKRRGGKTKRDELLAVLKEKAGISVRGRPARRFKEGTRLRDIESDALVFCDVLTLKKDRIEDSSRHWVVWDSAERVLRDPLSQGEPLKLRSFTELTRD